MSDQPDEEKKLHVDENWKDQVEAEKKVDTAAAKEPTGPGGPMPEPSLSMLITTLATQAMVSLGGIPNPLTGKAEVSFDQAHYLIDLIEMLTAKTEGNRTDEETAMMQGILHELRMAFVASQQAPPAEAPKE
ncbi:MAG: DUF1844 domain-containing protein [Planctomycetes bacterium]|nr:DUF1844 domain-containing protein [Planctomycetota bacterium]